MSVVGQRDCHQCFLQAVSWNFEIRRLIMKSRTILTACFICLILMAGTYAQGSSGGAMQGFTAGDRVFNLNGSGSSNEDIHNNSFSVIGSLSWFMDDAWEFGFRQGFGVFDVPGSNNDYVASSRFTLDRNFNMGSLWPLIGISGGYIYGDAVKDQFVAGPEGGLRWFVNDTTFIQGMLEYQFLFDNDNDSRDVFDDGRYVYSLGMGFKF